MYIFDPNSNRVNFSQYRTNTNIKNSILTKLFCFQCMAIENHIEQYLQLFIFLFIGHLTIANYGALFQQYTFISIHDGAILTAWFLRKSHFTYMRYKTFKIFFLFFKASESLQEVCRIINLKRTIFNQNYIKMPL